MFARYAMLAAILAFAPMTTAYAQEAPATPASAPSREHIAAAGDLLQALLFESGVVAAASDSMATQRMPALRASVLNSPLFNSVTPAHQARWLAHLDTMPELMNTLITDVFGDVAERAAPRVTARLTADELAQIAVFMRTPEMRSMLLGMVERRVGGESANAHQPFGDWRRGADGAVNAFALTPAGQAFEREELMLAQIFAEETNTVMSGITPRVQSLIYSGLCEALEDECPPQIRSALGHD